LISSLRVLNIAITLETNKRDVKYKEISISIIKY